jgi:dTDP-4-dehydrorhamnose 3,5-epimerase
LAEHRSPKPGVAGSSPAAPVGVARRDLASLPPPLRGRYELADDVRPPAERDAPTVDEVGRRVESGIEGVLYAPATPHVDHRGSLAEIVNFDNDFWDEPIVYSYCFTIRPGRIKGWAMHRKQADRYFLCAGNVRVVLHDGRVRSPTFGAFAEFHLTEDSRGLLLIPPGVWHGDQNWGDSDAVMLNFPTLPFDSTNPDKYRIDPHSGKIPFDWSLPDG